MSAFTIRLADDKYQRLKALSAHRGTSVNRLIDEMATMMLAEAGMSVLRFMVLPSFARAMQLDEVLAQQMGA